MENSELFKKVKQQVYMFIAIILLTISGIVLLIIRINGANDICVTCIIAGLIMCLLLILILAIWIYNQRLKQLLEYSFNQEENEKRRTYEEKQSQLNHNYRLEVLKQETFHQIVKEISEKKENTENPKEKVIKIFINHSLIEDIKTVKDKIDKTL
jgi:hypothetical protein